ncbi:MAG: hypothetical protein DRO87_11345 [Candidatus Thorarchaeota archaeon]|nr:MAG: hypothetical protein DRO87_11345 [Candidatus Thorarchaeota archaeon]
MGTKIFDLFFSRKGALTKEKYFWPRMFVAIVMLATELDLAAALKTERMFFGYPYIWLDIALYIVVYYSIYTLDSKRLKDMGRKTCFAAYFLVLLFAAKIFPVPLSLVFGLPTFFYYFWLISTPSRPAVEVFGTKITYDAYDRLRESYDIVKGRQNEIGEDAFREEVLKNAKETIEKATELIDDPRLPADEKELMRRLLEKAKLAKKELEEEKEDEDEKD